MLQVELFPVGEDAPPICRYAISVYTSDLRGTTDSCVCDQICSVGLLQCDLVSSLLSLTACLALASTIVKGVNDWLLLPSPHTGAGTDANVFCVLHGENGQTPRTMLESSKNDFER